MANWLRFGRERRMMRSPEEAVVALAEAMPAFAAIDAVVSSDGRAALAIDAAGRIAVVRLVGRKASAREVAWQTLRQTYEGILVETGDRRFGTVALLDVDALDVRRLGQERYAA